MAENPRGSTLSGGAAAAGADGAAPAAAGAPRRRRGQQEVQEVVDELAQETKRTSLLERVETQLKGQTHFSRLLFGFGVADDRKVQGQIEDDFAAWREKQEGGVDGLTGFLIYTSHGAVQLLEGPTELLFAALTFFNELAAEVTEQDQARPALVGPVRVFHFTELHGVRCSRSWCSYVHGGKLAGGQQVALDDTSCTDFMFRVYQKMLLICLRAKETLADDDDADDPSSLQAAYKKGQDQLPTVDEVTVLLGKTGVEFFFGFEEFHQVFIAPFHLVLHSELLWPMPPALAY